MATKKETQKEQIARLTAERDALLKQVDQLKAQIEKFEKETPPYVPPIEEPPAHPPSPPTPIDKPPFDPTIPIGDRKPPQYNDFDIERLKRPFKGVPTLSTNDFSGKDLGLRIMQADAKLGNKPGIIKIEYQPGLEFLSSAFPMFENRWFIFGDGVFKNRTGDYGRVLHPRNNSLISGTSYDAIVEEAEDIKNQPPRHSVFCPYNKTVVPYALGESTANILKSFNIHYFGFQIRGQKSNPANDIGLSTIEIGNDDYSSVQDMLFRYASGYDVSVGSTPGAKTDGGIAPNGQRLGYHARHCAILRNTFEESLTQNLGLISFDGLLVEDNKFLNSTRENPDGSPSPFSSVLDVEPNGDPREVARGVKIRRNVINCEKSNGALYFGGIAFQVHDVVFNEDNEITDNEIFDVLTNKSQLAFGITINGAGTNGLLVARNKISECGQFGIFATGKKLTLLDNLLNNTGGGGNPGMRVDNLSDSIIKNTEVKRTALNHSLDIFESGTNTNNLWEGNKADGIYHLDNSTVTKSKYKNPDTKVFESANSKNNVFEGNK